MVRTNEELEAAEALYLKERTEMVDRQEPDKDTRPWQEFFNNKLAARIEYCKAAIAKFQQEVANGTGLCYIVRQRLGEAVEAEETLQHLLRLQNVGLDDEVQALNDIVVNNASYGTHRSTSQWDNAMQEAVLKADAALLRDLRQMQVLRRCWLKPEAAEKAS